MSVIYGPAEDSYLLASVIPSYVRGKTVLDMGTGSGILAKTAIEAGARSVIAVDINPQAVQAAQKKGIGARVSDMFSKTAPSQTFDVIICNPPYLPEDFEEDKESKIITTGGKNGDEFILRFLKSAVKHLNKNGKILLLVSSLTPQKRMNALISKLNLKKRVVDSKKIFFERLIVWEIRHIGNNYLETTTDGFKYA